MLGGVVVLGQYLRSRLEDSGEHAIAFADIECDAPPGMTRADFLGEAQYLANLPNRLEALAPSTHQQIFDALALHPWVARVRRVEFPTPGSARADLEFRRPALVVPPDRVVDGEGILLPSNTTTKALPLLRGKLRTSLTRTGQVWEDPAVLAASRVASLLQDVLLRYEARCEIEAAADSIVLDLGNVRIVWGSPPGQERPGEVPASIKVQRLTRAGALDGMQWDLRPEAGLARSSK